MIGRISRRLAEIDYLEHAAEDLTSHNKKLLETLGND